LCLAELKSVNSDGQKGYRRAALNPKYASPPTTTKAAQLAHMGIDQLLMVMGQPK